MTITIPYPPTVNSYWRHAHGRTYISEAGLAYRDAVRAAFIDQGYLRDMCSVHATLYAARLHVTLAVYPPDRRHRDLDNIGKVTLDALEDTGVYADDNQIDVLTIRRCAIRRGGLVEVKLEKL